MTPNARTIQTRPVIHAAPEPDTQRSIPFDYTFKFDLRGEPNRTHRSVVTVSVESSFTAVSVGYGVIPMVTPIIFGPSPQIVIQDKLVSLRNLNFNHLLNALQSSAANNSVFRSETGTEVALNAGIRLNPQFAELALLDSGNGRLPGDVWQSLFQVVSAPSGEIQFLYALFDDGSGREFQSEPLLNTAGLGISNGDRPFRYFARPITFAPRSTIRMEVTEKSDFQGELHVSLHGYKVLGTPGTPTAANRRLRRRGRRQR